jgi:glycine/D-amino acid oxidase-like deaminating enzyme
MTSAGVHDPRLDVLILGGGAAGMWLLDDLHRLGHTVALAEAVALGTGQTIASQGIIHGGLKYALHGRATKAARAIRGMPLRWRRSLAGEHEPDLTNTRRRAEYCTIWATKGLRSRLGLLGASTFLSVRPSRLTGVERPEMLRGWPGPVLRLGEQVIEPGSFLQTLCDRHTPRLLRIDGHQGVTIQLARDGNVQAVELRAPDGQRLVVRPRHLVLAAGEGNSRIRNRLGLTVEHIQQRPLQMVMLKGGLPILNGHCVRHAKPWLTITSTRDHADEVIWQLGGTLAEDMANATRGQTLQRARTDLTLALPEVDFSNTGMTTYHAVRAEGTADGRRPDQPTLFCDGNIITAWPTKLALVPRLCEMIVNRLPEPEVGVDFNAPPRWPRPAVAIPPWELESTWIKEH